MFGTTKPTRQVRSPDVRHPQTGPGRYGLNVRDTSSVRIVLSRDIGFGTCPAYSIDVSGDGGVRFTGEKYVDSLRPAPTTVGRDTVIALLRAAIR